MNASLLCLNTALLSCPIVQNIVKNQCQLALKLEPLGNNVPLVRDSKLVPALTTVSALLTILMAVEPLTSNSVTTNCWPVQSPPQVNENKFYPAFRSLKLLTISQNSTAWRSPALNEVSSTGTGQSVTQFMNAVLSSEAVPAINPSPGGMFFCHLKSLFITAKILVWAVPLTLCLEPWFHSYI